MRVGARDDDVAGLDRLAQRLEHGAGELGELVEEQHAVVGEADLARASRRARRRRSPPSRRCGAACGTGGRARCRPPPAAPRGCGSSRSPAPPRGSSGGRMPGRRAASIDLPDPGGPTIRMWWRPAAAISSARLARSWPFTSERSRGRGGRLDVAGLRRGDRGAAGEVVDQRQQVFGAMTCTAPTQAASAPQAAGQISPQSASAAAIAAGSAPITAISAPSSDSSPSATLPATASRGRTSIAASTASAIGRSKCEPSLGRSAGDRFTVIRLAGSARPIAVSAARTRSWPPTPPCRAGRRG